MAVKAKIVGATGYGGVGVIELLLRHPQAEIVCLTAKADVGAPISDFFPHLRGHCDLPVYLTDDEPEHEPPDVVFMSTPDGVAMKLARAYLDAGVKVIDYSADFRLKDVPLHDKVYGIEHADPELTCEAVYGLPELHREEIRNARLIANPGCFAVASILGAAPALRTDLVDPASVIIDAKTGVSGAGKKPNAGHHFPARNENMAAYKIASHRHAPEIEQELSGVVGAEVRITFTPHIIPITRGIIATVYGNLKEAVSQDQALDAYRSFYAAEPFVRVQPAGECPGTLSVRASNHCDITVAVDSHTNRLVVVSVIDNLVKGQAGSALQNMNVLFGLPETMGLNLPPVFP